MSNGAEMQARSYEHLQRVEHARYLKPTHSLLQSALGQDEGRIRFGPTYLITTSHLEALSIDALLINIPPEEMTTFKHYKTIVLIARNVADDIVGHRFSKLHIMDDYIASNGHIATAQRGIGIATSLEFAHFDLLSREASRVGKDIFHNIGNDNQSEKQKLQERLVSSSEPEDQNLLNSKMLEQVRWRSLYLPHGKLGFDEFGTKRFRCVPSMNPEYENIETIAEIELDSLSGTIHGSKPIPNPAEHRAQRLQYLKQNLLPRIAAIVG